MEIEAKFALPDLETLHRLAATEHLAGFDLLTGQVKQVCDTYLDTCDRRILAAGYACRRREHSDGILITLKELKRSEGAVHRREELEVSLPVYQPALQWPPSPVRDRVLNLIAEDPLTPLFELEQTRTVRPVSRGDQVVAELSLDEVLFTSGASAHPLLELEVELLAEGTENDLAEMVTCLRDEWRLQPEPRSKFERALRFLDQHPTPNRLLTSHERDICQRIAERNDRYSRRAMALLALDDGQIQKKAGKRAHLSERSVRYWLARFRQGRLDIFPARIQAEATSMLPPSEIGEMHVQADTVTAIEVEGAAVLPELPERPAEPRIKLRAKPGLEADDSMAEAARKTLHFHLQRMLYHEPGTRKGEDIEELHDMRVATRRMRASMHVFGSYLDPKQMAPFVKGLRRTGRALGAVRDLDVFREKMQLYLDTLPPGQQDALNPLLTVWQAQRDTARKKMLTYLNSARYLRFKTEFGEFLEKPNAGALPAVTRQGEPIPHRLRHVVPVVIYQRLAAVHAYEEWVTGPDVPLERLHQLRIACKALRYALEFFREVLGAETKTLIDTMKALQDHLGNLQDAVVACNLLRDFLTWGTWGHQKNQRDTWPSEPVVAPGVVTYMAVRQTEIQQLVGTFPQAWSQIQSPEFHHMLETALAMLW